MIDIATAQITSSAPPSAFFDRWADMATWPEWNLDTEWVRLDGPFVQGATGMLKPKGGPKVRFVVASLVPDREFIDVSRLVGARLTFDHRVSDHRVSDHRVSDHHVAEHHVSDQQVFDHRLACADGGCTVEVRITMSGPLAWLWNRILGKDLRATVQADLERLAQVAEAAHTGAA